MAPFYQGLAFKCSSTLFLYWDSNWSDLNITNESMNCASGYFTLSLVLLRVVSVGTDLSVACKNIIWSELFTTVVIDHVDHILIMTSCKPLKCVSMFMLFMYRMITYKSTFPRKLTVLYIWTGTIMQYNWNFILKQHTLNLGYKLYRCFPRK